MFRKWEKINDNLKERLKLERKEFLVYNSLQGGVLSLVIWNNIHKYFQCKGEYYNLNDYSFVLFIPDVPETIKFSIFKEV